MRIITLNANGIRAAVRKGLPAWLAQQDADFVCLQEVRATQAQMTDEAFWPDGYVCHYHSAEKAGYSGVALYSRRDPDEVIEGLGWPEIDREARYLEVRIENLSVVSFYLPSGSSGEVRQGFKYQLMDRLVSRFEAMVSSGRDYVVCGDWNIAHKEIDLRNWRSNRKNSGFLPDERAWLDRLYDEVGMLDAFRLVDQEPERYTWWSNRGRAWDNNVGWRLDLQVVTPSMRERVKRASIYTDERFSDHAPLLMDYDYRLTRRRRARRRTPKA